MTTCVTFEHVVGAWSVGRKRLSVGIACSTLCRVGTVEVAQSHGTGYKNTSQSKARRAFQCVWSVIEGATVFGTGVEPGTGAPNLGMEPGSCWALAPTNETIGDSGRMLMHTPWNTSLVRWRISTNRTRLPRIYRKKILVTTGVLGILIAVWSSFICLLMGHRTFPVHRLYRVLHTAILSLRDDSLC